MSTANLQSNSVANATYKTGQDHNDISNDISNQKSSYLKHQFEHLENVVNSNKDAFFLAYMDGKLSNFYDNHLPPVGNTGVMEGEAIIDWLTVTWEQAYDDTDLEACEQLLMGVAITFGIRLKPENRNSGINNFTYSKEGKAGALFAWGGDGQGGRVMLKLPGAACRRVRDWRRVYLWCRFWNARITRVDVAYDDIEGVHGVDETLRRYENGEFHIRGVNPGYEQAGQWGKVNEKGRTVYIGSRKAAKYMRVYEKGKQMGDPLSRWVRHEVEFKRGSGRDAREVPLDIMLDPTKYLKGAYPVAFDWLEVDGQKIPTRGNVEALKITVRQAIKEAKRQYGKLVNVLQQIGMSPNEIVTRITRDGVPGRLEPYQPRRWEPLEVFA